MKFLEPRFPGAARALAITTLWIWRTLAGLAVACPIVLAFESSGIASGPEHDAPLFQQGALVLLEALRLGGPAIAAGLELAALLLAISFWLGLAPLAFVLQLLRQKAPLVLRENALSGARVLPQFGALALLAGLSNAALLLGASLLGGVLGAALKVGDERVQTLAPFAVFGLALIGMFVVAAVHDVARAVVVESGDSARIALPRALILLRERPVALLLGFYPCAAAHLGVWLCAAWLLTRIDLANLSGRNIVLAFLVHQVAILIAISIRVRWLSCALELAKSARE